jgi:hypothetical protein
VAKNKIKKILLVKATKKKIQVKEFFIKTLKEEFGSKIEYFF